MKRAGVLSAIGILVLSTLFLMPAAGQAQRKRMTIGTASIGGAYYPVGTGIASLINKYVPEVEARVEVTGGAVENPRLIGDGQTDLGISNTSTAYFALKGMKPYPKTYPIRALAQMYPSTLHMVTRKDFDVRTLTDLKGKRVAVGPAGGGTISILQDLLTTVGMRVKDFKPSYISYNDGSMALQDGNVHASILLAGAPTAAVLELGTRTPIQFIRVEEATVQKFLKEYPYYLRIVIPKSYYKTEEDVVTVGAGNVLIVNEAMSDDLAYKITAALYDHIDEFRKVHPSTKVVDLKSAPDAAIPLHPGAARYYREKGVLK